MDIYKFNQDGKVSNFIPIYDWMLTNLSLKGAPLLCFAIIYSYTFSGTHECFDGSISYLSRRTGYEKKTIIDSLKKLVDEGLVEKKEFILNSVKNCTYKVGHFEVENFCGEVDQKSDLRSTKNCTGSVISTHSVISQGSVISTHNNKTSINSNISSNTNNISNKLSNETFTDNNIYNNDTNTDKNEKNVEKKSSGLFSVPVKSKKEVNDLQRQDKYVRSCDYLARYLEVGEELEQILHKYFIYLAQSNTFLPQISIEEQINLLKKCRNPKKAVNDTISRGWKSICYSVDMQNKEEATRGPYNKPKELDKNGKTISRLSPEMEKARSFCQEFEKIVHKDGVGAAYKFFEESGVDPDDYA